jgi:hypothetical protein
MLGLWLEKSPSPSKHLKQKLYCRQAQPATAQPGEACGALVPNYMKHSLLHLHKTVAAGTATGSARAEKATLLHRTLPVDVKEFTVQMKPRQKRPKTGLAWVGSTTPACHHSHRLRDNTP